MHIHEKWIKELNGKINDLTAIVMELKEDISKIKSGKKSTKKETKHED